MRRCYRCNSSRHLVKDCRVNKLHATSDTEEEEAKVNVCFGDGDLMTEYDVMRNYQSVESDGCVPVCKSGHEDCLLYTSPSPRDRTRSRMPSSA